MSTIQTSVDTEEQQYIRFFSTLAGFFERVATLPTQEPHSTYCCQHLNEGGGGFNCPICLDEQIERERRLLSLERQGKYHAQGEIDEGERSLNHC